MSLASIASVAITPAHLYVLQRQVLSWAASIYTESRCLAGDGVEQRHDTAH